MTASNLHFMKLLLYGGAVHAARSTSCSQDRDALRFLYTLFSVHLFCLFFSFLHCIHRWRYVMPPLQLLYSSEVFFPLFCVYYLPRKLCLFAEEDECVNKWNTTTTTTTKKISYICVCLWYKLVALLRFATYTTISNQWIFAMTWLHAAYVRRIVCSLGRHVHSNSKYTVCISMCAHASVCATQRRNIPSVCSMRLYHCHYQWNNLTILYGSMLDV